jgi:hypothetical protein
MRVVSIHCLALGMSALICSTTEAQITEVGTAGRPSATRAELDSLAARAEVVASSGAVSAQMRAEKQREAAVLRARLRDGDFEVGDRVVLTVRDSALSDTFAVQPGRTLNLPNLPPLSLAGVLRSELRSHLVAQVGRFVKDTTLRATALIRFGVLGEVARPGYYRLSADIPISDALMAAGGPTARADVPRTVVRRGSKQLLSKRTVRQAMVAGLTLDELNLGPGDEIVVGEKRERGWRAVASAAALAGGLVVGLRSAGVF